MTKIFLDNYGVLTTPYYGKDGCAVIGFSEYGYKCLQKFLEREEFKGTLNKIISESAIAEIDGDIKFVMVVNKLAFPYIVGCLNTSVLFMEEPLTMTDVCQIVFQDVTLDSYTPNEAEHNYHLFSIDKDLYKFSYKRDKEMVDTTLVGLADKGEEQEPSIVWHSIKPDATSSNDLLVKLATLNFSMTESELANALASSALTTASAEAVGQEVMV